MSDSFRAHCLDSAQKNQHFHGKYGERSTSVVDMLLEKNVPVSFSSGYSKSPPELFAGTPKV